MYSIIFFLKASPFDNAHLVFFVSCTKYETMFRCIKRQNLEGKTIQKLHDEQFICKSAQVYCHLTIFLMLRQFSICISAPTNMFHLRFWLCWMALGPNLSSSSIECLRKTKYTQIYPDYQSWVAISSIRYHATVISCDITPGLALLSLGPLHCPDPWQYQWRTCGAAG